MSENETTRTELSKLGEFGLIERISNSVNTQLASSKLGIGDDAAVIASDQDSDILVSTDMLIEGVHFDLSYMPLKHLGYKSVVVNLSDIYAMGGTPKQITVSLALSNRFSVEAIDVFYEGVAQACKHYKVDLVGGDTTSSLKGLIISVTAIGAVNKDEAVKRSTAKVGDLICVTGDLGAAYLGLQVLNREKQVYMANPNAQPDLAKHQYLVGRQLKPEARRDVIEALQKAGLKPTSMIDISDGLSSELLHICSQSKVGCLIEEAKVPIHNDTYNQALEFQIDPITCALNGGEDYELLFTMPAGSEEAIDALQLDISIIGDIREEKDQCQLLSRANHYHELIAQGWNPIKKG